MFMLLLDVMSCVRLLEITEQTVYSQDADAACLEL